MLLGSPKINENIKKIILIILNILLMLNLPRQVNQNNKTFELMERIKVR